VPAGPLLRRLGPPRGQPECPRCHREGQGRPGPGSGPAAARGGRSSRAVEGIRGRSGSLATGLARAVARRSLLRSTGTGPLQGTRPRPTPAWSSFTSPARRVDHQVQLRRRSGDGCPPRPTAPRKWTTHTCIPIRRRREQSNDRSLVPFAVAAPRRGPSQETSLDNRSGSWPRRGRDRAGIGPLPGQPWGVEWTDQPDRPLATSLAACWPQGRSHHRRGCTQCKDAGERGLSGGPPGDRTRNPRIKSRPGPVTTRVDPYRLVPIHAHGPPSPYRAVLVCASSLRMVR